LPRDLGAGVKAGLVAGAVSGVVAFSSAFLWFASRAFSPNMSFPNFLPVLVIVLLISIELFLVYSVGGPTVGLFFAFASERFLTPEATRLEVLYSALFN
jgi:hypothetical protein